MAWVRTTVSLITLGISLYKATRILCPQGTCGPVGLLGPSSPEWVVALLAIVRSGALAMPLSEQLSDAELAQLIEHSGARTLFTTAPYVARTSALDRIERLILLDHEAAPNSGGDDARSWRALARDEAGPLPDLGVDQMALLLYTSGTTGTPKGVPLSHGNLCANLRALEAAALARPDDRVLLPLPLHHAYPLTVGLLAPLAIGAAVILPAGITGPQIMRALREHGCTIMIAVPRLYEAMLAGIERQVAGMPRPLQLQLMAIITTTIMIMTTAIIITAPCRRSTM